MSTIRDKYALYHNSVQNPEADIDFMKKAWKRKFEPDRFVTMREDFCGTFANTVAWVRENPKHVGVGIDLDPEPISYGKKHYLSKVSSDEKARVTIIEGNVLQKNLPRADVVCAFNFSYYIIQDRKTLLAYFSNVFRSLNKQGMFILDCFGGSKTHVSNDHRVNFPKQKYTYSFEQKSFDPIQSRATFAIHFLFKSGRSLKNAFTYDWRMWTIKEIRELMEEAGFSSSIVLWEGLKKDGTGNGVFRTRERGEECESWTGYIAAYKDQ